MACASTEQTVSVPAKTAAPKALDRANLDTTCAACTDFYTFANGGWLKSTTIPADTRVGLVLRAAGQERSDRPRHHRGRRRATATPDGEAGIEHFKVGAYYDACMDTMAIETLGTKPIDASMARIARITSAADLPRALAELETIRRPRAVRRRRRPRFQELESPHRQRRPGRPDPARARLLSVARLEHAAVPRRVRRARRELFQLLRRKRRRREGARADRARHRDEVRAGVDGPRHAARTRTPSTT